MSNNKYEFIIIGGGIAGTTCAQRLCTIVDPGLRVLILSAAPVVKSAINIKPVTKLLNTFDIQEQSPNSLTDIYKNLTILHKNVSELDAKNHIIECSDGSVFTYDKLCICTGGKPKLICENNPNVLGIRDTETVSYFQQKLKDARQVAVIGNGGIATELVFEIENCKIVWIIKDDHISHVFFDPHSAKFFETRINESKMKNKNDAASGVEVPLKRSKYSITKVDMSEQKNDKKNVYGSALGPDWSFDLPIKGAAQESHVSIEYKCEIKSILTNSQYRELTKNEHQTGNELVDTWPVYVQLANGKIIGCDLVISATGVVPAVDLFTKNNHFEIGSDGGLKVNDKLETSIGDVFAAGDSCTASWKFSPHWFQMRLWSQARQMGDYAARSMWASFKQQPIELDFCFEIFAHITNFFGYKVILLGNYDAKNLGNDYELLIRCTEGVEYVKIVVYKGKVQGALLIGETDLEETFENLILNQIDVSAYGENLINPDIDIEDYFD